MMLLAAIGVVGREGHDTGAVPPAAVPPMPLEPAADDTASVPPFPLVVAAVPEVPPCAALFEPPLLVMPAVLVVLVVLVPA